MNFFRFKKEFCSLAHIKYFIVSWGLRFPSIWHKDNLISSELSNHVTIFSNKADTFTHYIRNGRQDLEQIIFLLNCLFSCWRVELSRWWEMRDEKGGSWLLYVFMCVQSSHSWLTFNMFCQQTQRQWGKDSYRKWFPNTIYTFINFTLYFVFAVTEWVWNVKSLALWLSWGILIWHLKWAKLTTLMWP